MCRNHRNVSCEHTTHNTHMGEGNLPMCVCVCGVCMDSRNEMSKILETSLISALFSWWYDCHLMSTNFIIEKAFDLTAFFLLRFVHSLCCMSNFIFFFYFRINCKFLEYFSHKKFVYPFHLMV